MLRYLSEQVKAGLEPFGIGIILALIIYFVLIYFSKISNFGKQYNNYDFNVTCFIKKLIHKI